MKRIAFAAVFAAMTTTALSGIAFAQDVPSLPADGAKISLKTVTQTLPTLPQYTAIELPIYKDMAQWSHGRVTVEPSTWAEYGVQAADILNLVRQRQIDVGAAPLAQVAGQVPFLEIADLAGISPTVEDARKVSEAVISASNDQLKKFDIKIIATYPFPANVLFCKDEVKSLADLSGRKVRTFSASQNDLVQSLGGQTVSIGFPEVYSALERGVADCAVTAALSGNAAKWFEVTRSMLNVPVSWGVGGYYVSLSWWNGLDAPTRDFLAASFKKIEDQEWDLAKRGSADGIACNIGDAAGCKIGTLLSGAQKMSVVEPTPADAALLKEKLSSAVLPAWVKRCGADCATKFNEIVAPIAGLKIASK